MEPAGERTVQFHLFIASVLYEGNNFTPWQFCIKERTHGTHCKKKLGGSQGQPGLFVKQINLVPCRRSNEGSSVVHYVALSLHQPSYPGSWSRIFKYYCVIILQNMRPNIVTLKYLSFFLSTLKTWPAALFGNINKWKELRK